jgi:glutathione synthase/RimK-type ligase-like ATP-grasp enzyme
MISDILSYPGRVQNNDARLGRDSTPRIFYGTIAAMNDQQPISNTACLAAACDKLGITYRFYDDNHNLMGVMLDKEYFFANATTPFNSEAFSRISQDKEFSYRVYSDVIRMPKTLGFLDPECDPKYRHYVVYQTRKEIVQKIDTEFKYPVIVKMNSGSQGVNVFKCDDIHDIEKAIDTIFNRDSLHYDYVALAQEYISLEKEFRVIVLKNEVELVYEKDTSEAGIPIGNISPLHRSGAKAVVLQDENLKQKIKDFVGNLSKKISIKYVGLDVALDTNGDLWLIEINTKPGFGYFIRDNGPELIIELYKNMLLELKTNPC